MTLKEFDNYLYSPDFPYKGESLIVFIADKYNYEKEYLFEPQLLLENRHLVSYYEWEVDWCEGQQDVEVLGYVPISQVHRFIPLNCEHKLHMVGEDHLINEFLEKINEDSN